MKKSGALWAVMVVILLGLAGAGQGRSLLEQVATDVARQSPQGRNILKDFARYQRLASVFKKYHDKGNLDDGDLLNVLRDAGVIDGGGTGAKPAKGTKTAKDTKTAAPAKKPKPFPVSNYGGQYRWPMSAGIVSSEFGPRWGKIHQGIDIAADSGVPIHAAAAGEVIYSGSHITGYGNVVILRHDQQTTTTYAHNSALKVRKGEKVKAGQLIALLGSTGHSTGPHLHFEFRVANTPVNPREKLPKSGF